MFGTAYRSIFVHAVAIAAIGAGFACPALAAGDEARLDAIGWANPPIGHIAFCKSYPSDCAARGGSGPVLLDADRWAALQTVNILVNREIEPATDLDVYRAEEVWTLPELRGDCEDYVLLKRNRLIAQGWPTGALLVSVVFDEVGEGHAVLLVRTTAGDLTLDNKRDAILPWNQTGYRFVKRQSETDPRRWVAVGRSHLSSRNTAAPN